MVAAPSRDWRVFKQICAEHWEAFQHAPPRYQTSYDDSLVTKMLAGGNPAKMGYLAYRWQQCGQGKPLGAMSCKASLCLRCAKVDVANGVSQGSQVLHEGVIYRHLIRTVPAMFRTTCYHNAGRWGSAVMRCGVPCLDDCYSEGRGKARRGGSITVLHTHGRHGQSHPHLHLLATSGGSDAPGERWAHLRSFPYELLRRTWQWHLLSTLRTTLATEAVKGLGEVWFRKYPNGLVPNVQKGNVSSQYQSLARYVAKDMVSPPRSVRRIDCDDGKRGTSPSRSHRTERVERETIDVDMGIGRLGQHTLPKGCKRIRYDGVQATKTLATVTVIIQAALAKVEGVVKGAVKLAPDCPPGNAMSRARGALPYGVPPVRVL